MNIISLLAHATLLFLSVVEWMVIVHVVISWILPLLGVGLIIYPLEVVMGSLYGLVRRLIPTRVGMFEFAPAIIVFLIQILANIVSQFL